MRSIMQTSSQRAASSKPILTGLLSVLATASLLLSFLLPKVALADTAYFARLGYDYPETWGVGPFASLDECSRQMNNIYGANAYKWHCEIHTYVGQPGTEHQVPNSTTYPKFYARYGYTYPEVWGSGPFGSFSDCSRILNQIYGANAYKWHCEIHT